MHGGTFIKLRVGTLEFIGPSDADADIVSEAMKAFDDKKSKIYDYVPDDWIVEMRMHQDRPDKKGTKNTAYKFYSPDDTFTFTSRGKVENIKQIERYNEQKQMNTAAHAQAVGAQAVGQADP